MTRGSHGPSDASRLRLHGWLWTIVGSLMLLCVLWQQPRATHPETLTVLGLGALDVTAGILVLRRTRTGRSLLSLTLLGHLAVAVWLWYGAQAIPASPQPSQAQMTYAHMTYQTTAQAMVGMSVLLLQGLAAVSVLLCCWTAVDLYRSRTHR